MIIRWWKELVFKLILCHQVWWARETAGLTDRSPKTHRRVLVGLLHCTFKGFARVYEWNHFSAAFSSLHLGNLQNTEFYRWLKTEVSPKHEVPLEAHNNNLSVGIDAHFDKQAVIVQFRWEKTAEFASAISVSRRFSSIALPCCASTYEFHLEAHNFTLPSGFRLFLVILPYFVRARVLLCARIFNMSKLWS